ncbi:MAG: MaoC family dehydratase [Burkholderiales bacterium]|nr:MaoC family dehydratase [Burkholderiales bacterium]
MNAVMTSPLIGREIDPASYSITRESIARYSRYVFDGRDTRNIHTDDEIARRAGLPGAVAQGRYPIGYMSERAFALFGRGWIEGGHIDVTLVRPIFPGDTVTVRGVITAIEPLVGASRLVLEMYLENQDGLRVTTGTVSGIIRRQPATENDISELLANHPTENA